jgi:hypothetical protein
MPAARLFTANPPQRLARERPSVWCRHPDQGLHPLSPAASLACAQHVDFKRLDLAPTRRADANRITIWFTQTVHNLYRYLSKPLSVLTVLSPPSAVSIDYCLD